MILLVRAFSALEVGHKRLEVFRLNGECAARFRAFGGGVGVGLYDAVNLRDTFGYLAHILLLLLNGCVDSFHIFNGMENYFCGLVELIGYHIYKIGRASCRERVCLYV